MSVIDLYLLYQLVAVVEMRPHWTWENYSTALGVSRKTIHNIIERAKADEIGVMIMRKGTKRDGYWQVEELGILESDYARSHIEAAKRAYKLKPIPIPQ